MSILRHLRHMCRTGQSGDAHLRRPPSPRGHWWQPWQLKLCSKLYGWRFLPRLAGVKASERRPDIKHIKASHFKASCTCETTHINCYQACVRSASWAVETRCIHLTLNANDCPRDDPQSTEHPGQTDLKVWRTYISSQVSAEMAVRM